MKIFETLPYAKRKTRWMLFCLVSMILLATLGEAKIKRCAEGCKSCWGSRSDQCMGCDPGFILESFRCISVSYGCNFGRKLDKRDMICKR